MMLNAGSISWFLALMPINWSDVLVGGIKLLSDPQGEYMSLNDDLTAIVCSLGSELQEKKGVYSFEKVLAERKSFLSKKKLLYIARFRIDEEKREVRFTEMLKESGFGLSSGSDDMSPGFSFKKETYNTLSKAREGTIQEQSTLLGKQYNYTFDFAVIRGSIEAKAKEHGYEFTYGILKI